MTVCLWTFCSFGRFVPITFCPSECLVSEDVLSLECIIPLDILSQGCFLPVSFVSRLYVSGLCCGLLCLRMICLCTVMYSRYRSILHKSKFLALSQVLSCSNAVIYRVWIHDFRKVWISGHRLFRKVAWLRVFYSALCLQIFMLQLFPLIWFAVASLHVYLSLLTLFSVMAILWNCSPQPRKA
jgi:hypothetical protein